MARLWTDLRRSGTLQDPEAIRVHQRGAHKPSGPLWDALEAWLDGSTPTVEREEKPKPRIRRKAGGGAEIV